jgi:hypothetical protein
MIFTGFATAVILLFSIALVVARLPLWVNRVIMWVRLPIDFTCLFVVPILVATTSHSMDAIVTSGFLGIGITACLEGNHYFKVVERCQRAGRGVRIWLTERALGKAETIKERRRLIKLKFKLSRERIKLTRRIDRVAV